MDGFIVRRRTTTGGNRRLGLDDLSVSKQFLIDPSRTPRSANSQSDVKKMGAMNSLQPLELPRAHDGPIKQRGMGIDMTLDDAEIPKRRRRRAGFRLRKPSKRMVKLLAILILIIGVAYGGFFIWKVINNSGKVFNGNPLAAIFSEKPLKADQYGRTNVLIFGTSEDDKGHEAPYLTDSLMIASFSKDKKDAYLLSVPRDLWIEYGQTCFTGNRGKINVLYSCAAGEDSEGKPKDEQAGQTALRSKIGSIFGVNIQYSVHVNYTVVRQAVDAVGGITVTIESRVDEGVLDQNFDWKCGVGDPKVSRTEQIRRCPPHGHFIEYPNGPVNLDAEHALYLAQARGDCVPIGNTCKVTYGFEQSNFDREKNQQKILIALKEKATSLGVLANPVKITNLLDALGNNVRTNIDAEEVRSFISLANKLDAKKITSLTLVDPDHRLMTTGMVNGQSVVEPAAGTYNYEEIQKYVSANLSGQAWKLEDATIAVYNGSGVQGAAQKQADKLTAKGFTVDGVDTVATGKYGGKITLYDTIDGKKPATLKKLEAELKVKAIKTTTLPNAVTSSSDFVIIIGSNGAN